MDTYNFDEDLIEKPRRDPTPEPADDREVIECLWWTRSDWENSELGQADFDRRWRFSQPAWKAQSPLPEIRTLCSSLVNVANVY